MGAFKQYLGEGIEVEETYDEKGRLHAHTVGGQQVVKIVEMPAHTIKGDWTNPKPYTRKTRSGGTTGIVPQSRKEPDVHVQKLYWVFHDKGRTATPDYNEAVRLAIHHSRRKPRS